MSTEFISLLTPPGDAITNYDRTKLPTEQPTTVPQTFLDAMSIREEVFVRDQGVPLENELDEDDARSFHWVAYASVGTTGTTDPDLTSRNATTATATATATTASGSSSSSHERNRGGVANRVPVGCIRLVPPTWPSTAGTQTIGEGGGQALASHVSGSTAGSVHDVNSASLAESLSSPSNKRSDSLDVSASASASASVTTMTTSSEPDGPAYKPKEPYIKLGRLATLTAFRGLGLSRLLVNAVLEYTRHHGREMMAPPQKAAEAEAARIEGRPVQQAWQGLVVVHAQVQVRGLWERFGFDYDEKMGHWIEEGIAHVGLTRRLEIVGS